MGALRIGFHKRVDQTQRLDALKAESFSENKAPFRVESQALLSFSVALNISSSKNPQLWRSETSNKD